MRYFHVPLCQISGHRVNIFGRELHHLMDVVRLREGDEIVVLDGSGGIYKVILISCDQDVAIGEIKTRRQAQPSLIETALFVGLPKASKMDMIVQKATELGAHRITPVLCQHSVPHLSAERAQRRVARWRQVAVEASKQSHQPFFPFVSDILRFGEALGTHAHLRLIFVAPLPLAVREAVLEEHPILDPSDREPSKSPFGKGGFRGISAPKLSFLKGGTKLSSPESLAGAGSCVPLYRLKDVLKQNPEAKKVDIFIGPEGGFSADEIGRALSAGAVPVSLGDNILRTETAAIAALTIVLYEKDA